MGTVFFHPFLFSVNMTSNEWLPLLFNFDWSNPSFQKQFKQKLLKENMPRFLLGSFWKKLLLSKQTSLITTDQYTALLSSTEFKFDSEIKRDINRTFPELQFFKEKNSYGQLELYNVLKALSLYNPEVGYCQGMGFITGILLSHMNELDSLSCLAVLMSESSDHKMGGLYKPGLPLLSHHLTQFQEMIESELPELFSHFQNQGIEISMFGSQWILSLFIYNLKFEKSVQLFNLFLVYNYRVILLFGIFVLEEMESELLTLSFEGVLGRINNVDGVVKSVAQFVDWLEDEGGWEVGIVREDMSRGKRICS